MVCAHARSRGHSTAALVAADAPEGSAQAALLAPQELIGQASARCHLRKVVTLVQVDDVSELHREADRVSMAERAPGDAEAAGPQP